MTTDLVIASATLRCSGADEWIATNRIVVARLAEDSLSLGGPRSERPFGEQQVALPCAV